MEAFVDMLKVGGKTNSLGRASEVVDIVLVDQSKLDELYACLFFDDAWVRMRAADSLEKVCRVRPEWIEPRVDTMLDDFAVSEQPSIQWHLAQIFCEVTLTNEQRERVIAWLSRLLGSSEIDWIVSVNAMKALVKFYREGHVHKSKMTSLFTFQKKHKSSSVRKKATQFLNDL